MSYMDYAWGMNYQWKCSLVNVDELNDQLYNIRYQVKGVDLWP